MNNQTSNNNKNYSNRKERHQRRGNRNDREGGRARGSKNRSSRRNNDQKEGERTDYERLDYSRRVFVGSIDDKAENNDLIKYFSKFGKILDAEIIRHKDTGNSKNYGFIFCKHKDTVQKILGRSHKLFGKILDVNEAYDKKAVRKRNWSKDGKSRTLYITKVHNHTNQNDLREYFLQYGSVRRAYVVKK